MQEIEQKLTELRKKRDSLMTGFFKLGLQIALIFGIPAAIAAFLGTRLDKGSETNTFVTIFLFCSFVTSWIIVIRIYRKRNAEMEEIESQIKELKQSLPTKEND